MKICESCVHRRIVSVEDVPMGVNPDNRRLDKDGKPYFPFALDAQFLVLRHKFVLDWFRSNSVRANTVAEDTSLFF